MELEIKRIIGIIIRNLSLYDFQTAIELNIERTNLTDPVEEFPDNEGSLCWEITTAPEVGYNYINPNNDLKQKFRVSQIAKYSSETLKWHLENLELCTPKTQVHLLIEPITERLKLRDIVKKCWEACIKEPNPKRVLAKDAIMPSDLMFTTVTTMDSVREEEVTIQQETQHVTTSAAPDIMSKPAESTKKEEWFQEDDFSYMFRSGSNYQMLSYTNTFIKKDPTFKAAYNVFMNRVGRSRETVHSAYHISRIIRMKERTSQNIDFIEFEVEREDGQVYKFSEADFRNLNINDFWDMHRLLVGYEDRYMICRKGMVAVKGGMCRALLWVSFTDFQVALDMGFDQVNLSAPNTDLADIDRRKTGSIVERPEPGVIYKKRNKKHYFRISDVAKYSTGTLLQLSKAIDRKEHLYPDLCKNMSQIIVERLRLRQLVMLDFFPIVQPFL